MCEALTCSCPEWKLDCSPQLLRQILFPLLPPRDPFVFSFFLCMTWNPRPQPQFPYFTLRQLHSMEEALSLPSRLPWVLTTCPRPLSLRVFSLCPEVFLHSSWRVLPFSTEPHLLLYSPHPIGERSLQVPVSSPLSHGGRALCVHQRKESHFLSVPRGALQNYLFWTYMPAYHTSRCTSVHNVAAPLDLNALSPQPLSSSQTSGELSRLVISYTSHSGFS